MGGADAREGGRAARTARRPPRPASPPPPPQFPITTDRLREQHSGAHLGEFLGVTGGVRQKGEDLEEALGEPDLRGGIEGAAWR